MKFMSKSIKVFLDRDNISLKFIWKGKLTKIAKTILNKDNTFWEDTLSKFNIYSIATVI